MSEAQKVSDDFSLEEDDIFEEFEVDDYQAPQTTEPEADLWDPEWDDETATDEVADKIRQELEKTVKKSAAK